RERCSESSISTAELPKTPTFLAFLIDDAWSCGLYSWVQFPVERPVLPPYFLLRGKRDIPGRRQGHLPEPWARYRRTHRRENHSWNYLRVLSPAHRVERHDGAGASRQRRWRRPSQSHYGR